MANSQSNQVTRHDDAWTGVYGRLVNGIASKRLLVKATEQSYRCSGWGQVFRNVVSPAHTRSFNESGFYESLLDHLVRSVEKSYFVIGSITFDSSSVRL